jgi:hypothetical protein
MKRYIIKMEIAHNSTVSKVIIISAKSNLARLFGITDFSQYGQKVFSGCFL